MHNPYKPYDPNAEDRRYEDWIQQQIDEREDDTDSDD